MPFKSKAQQRFMFAAEARGEVPKGTAREWAHATKDIKSLPERKKKKKKAFVDSFLAVCVRDGIAPRDAVKVAEAYAATLEKAAAAKRAIEAPSGQALASAGGGAAELLGRLGILGTVGLPGLIGAGAGLGAGALHNQADRSDLETMRRLAMARAYRRRADDLQLRHELGKMQTQEPGKYVVLG